MQHTQLLMPPPIFTANQPVRQWFDREVLRELMHAARHAIEQKRLAYQAIRSAA